MDLPAYMSLKVFVKFFFVPHRRIDPDFEAKIAGTHVDTNIPSINNNGVTRLWDYGVSPGDITANSQINAYPIYAMNDIYNTYFKPDEINEVPLNDMNPKRVYFPQSSYYGMLKEELQQGTAEQIDTTAGFFTMAAFRYAQQRQKKKERRVMYGEEFRDVLLTDYGVTLPSTGLNRPEYCAAGS